jgi:predicted RNA-binding protein associated with RNAse of E/G family
MRWSGAGRWFSGWYVNFQDPFRRTADGFDSFDHVVDLVLGADGSYRWKDVEEFEKFVAEGRFTTAEVRAIRAETARVAADLDHARRWWDESFATWTPPSHWDNAPTGGGG